MSNTNLYFPHYMLSRFCVAGINYQKANTAVRSQFAIDATGYAAILEAAKQKGIRSLFILSTCNRTEIYGYTNNEEELTDLLTDHTTGDKAAFTALAYVKSGHEALRHFFNVACGLDSQITGDHEILSQIKKSVAFAQQYDMVGPIMDRTLNFALQASKKIKTVTNISNGTVSVSYAAIEWIRNMGPVADKQIAIVGLGKFGINVCRNIQHYLQPAGITLCNRTDEKAAAFAAASGLAFMPYRELPALVDAADIIIVCTQAGQPNITPQMVNGNKPRLFIDLSIPANVDEGVKAIAGQQVINVDEISVQLNATIARRKAEIPVAEKVIATCLAEFMEWLKMHQHSPLIKEMKNNLYRLNELQSPHFCTTEGQVVSSEKKIQQTVNKLAAGLRNNKEKGCQFIEAYNHFFNEQS